MMDNLAVIKLKLTCTNSIAAMNIYLYGGADEVPPCHGAKGDQSMDGLLGEDEDEDDEEEEYLQPYIVSNPFEARELTYN